MSIGTCYPCAKYLLLVLSIFFWLSGTALIVLGVLSLLHAEVRHVIHLFNLTFLPVTSIQLAAFCLIIIGIIIFLIGLFGLCGAQRESRTCLILYIVLVSCILLAELALFMYIAMHHAQLQTLIKERFTSQMKKYNHEYPSDYERAVDYVQSKYQCCGINSVYDYRGTYLPKSCCSKTNASICSTQQVESNGIPGCFRVLTHQTIYWGKYFILFELGLCLLSLIGIFLAICVCQNTMLYDGYIQAPYRV